MGDPFPQANFLVIVKKMGFGQKAVKALLAVCLMTPHAGLTDPWRAHFLDEEDTVAGLFLQHVSIEVMMNPPAKITELLGCHHYVRHPRMLLQQFAGSPFS
jgi:hypothetical protein